MAVSDWARILVGFGVEALDADADPQSPVGYTDVTQWGRAVKTDRGRASVFANYAGKATVTLLNNDARFDASNPDSPYAGLMTRNVPVLIQTKNADGSTWSNVFSGYTRKGSWKTSTFNSRIAVATLRLSDGSELVGSGKYEQVATAQRDGERTGTRVAHLADEYGWPSGWTDIDDGVADMSADTWGSSHWSHMLDAAEAEGGYLFFSADGYLKFIGRHGIATIAASPLTIHESVEDLPSSQVRGLRDSVDLAGFDDTLINYVSIRRNEGTTAEIVDARPSGTTPQIRFARDRSRLNNDRDTAALASWYAALWSQSVSYPKTVAVLASGPRTPAPAGTATPLTLVSGMDLRDRATVVYTPIGRTQQTYDVLIERVQHEINMQSDGAWRTTFGLSPFQVFESLDFDEWLILDDPVRGQLDTYRLGY